MNESKNQKIQSKTHCDCVEIFTCACESVYVCVCVGYSCVLLYVDV